MSDEPMEPMENAGEQSPLVALREELEAIRGRLRTLVRRAGRPAICAGCGARMYFIRHLDTGADTPYDPDGVTHFATCPKAENFRRRRRTTLDPATPPVAANVRAFTQDGTSSQET